MDTFQNFELMLKKLKYPNIMVMDESEIANIFSPKNRMEFLQWVLNKIKVNITSNSDEEKAIITGKVLWGIGISKKSDINSFIKSTLDKTAQVTPCHYN